MKTIDVGEPCPSLRDLLELADEETLLLRTASGREYVLAELDDFDREIALTRQNEELMALLDARSREPGAIPLAEARRRLEL